jgi:L-seryl-tRNA(Ser) seleniumtransferase
MARSGAILRDVGTTNKTRLEDYYEVIGPNTAMIMRVHTSNFRISGFTQKPDLHELIELAHRHHLPMVEDIGSGCLVDLSRFGIQDEPRAQEFLAAGADVVCFSGDKLLGGPQAGILAGARKWIDPIRKNPLYRTYRVDKLIYGALGATLSSYRAGREFQEIPVLRMISMSRQDMKARNSRFLRRLKPKLPSDVTLKRIDGESVVGGGSCPDIGLPTSLISLHSDRVKAHTIECRLRLQSPPIILRLEEDVALIDLRTVFPSQELALIRGLQSAMSE